MNAAWHLENSFAKGVMGGRERLYAWGRKFSYPRVPSGLRTTVDDPMKVTREIKKVATFFGASLVGVCELDRRWLYSYLYFTYGEGGEHIEKITVRIVLTVSGFARSISRLAGCTVRPDGE